MGLIKLQPQGRDDIRLLSNDLVFHILVVQQVVLTLAQFLDFQSLLSQDCLQVLNLLVLVVVRCFQL